MSVSHSPQPPLPPELLDLVCTHLHAKHDIQSARLVCRTFTASADMLLCDVQQSPSLLFGEIHPDLFRTKDGLASSEPVTLWTWLDIASSNSLHDPETDDGRRFRATVAALCNGASKEYGPKTSKCGPKASCWGRLTESPNSFCVITCELLWLSIEKCLLT